LRISVTNPANDRGLGGHGTTQIQTGYCTYIFSEISMNQSGRNQISAGFFHWFSSKSKIRAFVGGHSGRGEVISYGVVKRHRTPV